MATENQTNTRRKDDFRRSTATKAVLDCFSGHGIGITLHIRNYGTIRLRESVLLEFLWAIRGNRLNILDGWISAVKDYMGGMNDAKEDTDV